MERTAGTAGADRRTRTFEPCTVVDDACLAPAGYRVGNGIAYGTRSAKGRCHACGLPVCGKCSRIVTCRGRRRRVCLPCLEAEIGSPAMRRG